MKTGAKWGIGLGVGIPAVLILIGLIGLIIKFFMKRCRQKAWDDITTLSKDMESGETEIIRRKLPKRKASDRRPLYESASNNALEVSDNHVSIPIDETDIPASNGTKPKQTLVQIQRDRLNRMKEENRATSVVQNNRGEDEVQKAIDQTQKEFDESIATAINKLKRRRDK